MNKAWLWTGLILTLAAGGSYALYLHLQPAPLPDQLLYGNGHVEGTEVRVAAEVGGRVVESRLVEGKAVDGGALLVRIDDSDLVLRKERVAAQIDVLRSEREQAARELQVLQHHLGTAEADLERYRELRQRGTATPQRLAQAEDAYREAQGRVDEAKAGIDAIAARIEAAQKELDLVRNQVAKTRVTAPIAGTVLAKAVEVGEYVEPGRTVAVLVELSHLELKAFIPEKEIGKVRLDAPARVRVDAFPDRLFEGRVARVDQEAQFTPRDIHMPQERTRMVFGVTLALDNPERVLKPGMPADAWILWRPEAGWPERLSAP
ncbi:HlyD family secretion protein [Tistlia consotensis]|uniref:HlyD family secretion protein n=1 Tax=Tistlia consotensis USBA 355 TaxID=560819 RepID=A0A1Y6BTY5_9PROT|nr:efflux RND transporter periplasmic adaptor subunit [Tistlia consotensis]SMF27734.1 HlyD family secretion protein [Tistlia consotensis USBA 355]SNR65700.1 HlyD family secretion protein [Tistlia consotensis]